MICKQEQAVTPISPTLEANQSEGEDPEKDEEESMKEGEGLSQDGKREEKSEEGQWEGQVRRCQLK